ncbi:AAA family ATPase [Changpingibacter yushuensis]|uniref:AAA family ATPase n=1 Tax=Changpingibacter yushuensis TaxID=2758440 RepID=UPI00165D78BE|nr:AAA family ATPase [Changpingibacter yushuensis]
MYRQFTWLKDCGFFSDFTWNQNLPEFGRINVIYGPNGTGKTSLANALDDARTHQNPPGYTRLSAVIDGDVRTATEGQDNRIFARTFVFSEAFVSRAHNFSSGAADMPAILTIGEQTASAERKLKDLYADLDARTEEREKYCQKAAAAKKQVEKTYGTISQQVVAAAGKAGGRWHSRGTYSAGTVRRAFEGAHDDWLELSEPELKKNLSIINSSNVEEIDEALICVSPDDDLITRLTEALKSTPTTVMLGSLKLHPEASSWVSQGRTLHEGLSECIFCGSEIGADRLSDIDAHFSDSVTKLEHELKALVADINTLLESIATAVSELPSKGLFFEDLRIRHDTADEIARAELKKLRDWADNLRTRAVKKMANVLIACQYKVEPAPIVKATDLLELRKEHNKRVSEHDKQVIDAATAIEKHYLKIEEESVRTNKTIAKDADTCAATLKDGADGIDSLRDAIAMLENIEGDPLPSARVLTEEVRRLLGRNELEFTTVGERYNVTRDGLPAKGLSLGERTAITLVHFLEMVRCFDVKAGKPIVVIDDPVSSLDSDIFMGVSTYIWNEAIVKDHIAQLFLLTHNFELFRQWDIQIDALHRGGKIGGIKAKEAHPTEFYEIRPQVVTTSGTTKRRPVFESWPPSDAVRKKIRSTYHHGFMAVASQYVELTAQDTMEARLTAQLLFPNVIRRMLETFLAFKHPEWIGDFNGAMRNSAQLLEDAGYKGDPNALRLRLTRYAHAYSHSDTPITDVIVAPDEIMSAISAVFEFMHCLDPDHFNGLCQATNIDPDVLLT